MIAIANTIKELIEIRKFMTQMEEVLKIEYDKSKFVGKYVTKEERIEHDLPLEKEDDDHDELWKSFKRDSDIESISSLTY